MSDSALAGLPTWLMIALVIAACALAASILFPRRTRLRRRGADAPIERNGRDTLAALNLMGDDADGIFARPRRHAGEMDTSDGLGRD